MWGRLVRDEASTLWCSVSSAAARIDLSPEIPSSVFLITLLTGSLLRELPYRTYSSEITT